VFEDDVFIVSYPKSGNTWARFLLGNLYSQSEAVTFANIERKVPDIYQNSSKILSQLNRPRLLKSHEYLDPRYRRVIYIVRDPRDVVISYYNYMIKIRIINEDYPLLAFVEQFVKGGWDPFGSWGDHVGGWFGARKKMPDFLFLYYEDMLDDPIRELKKMATFLKLSFSDENIEKAVAMSSFQHMQDLEKLESMRWKPIKSSRKDKLFIRKAKKDEWRTELPQGAIEIIENNWMDIISSLGYRVGDQH